MLFKSNANCMLRPGQLASNGLERTRANRGQNVESVLNSVEPRNRRHRLPKPGANLEAHFRDDGQSPQGPGVKLRQIVTRYVLHDTAAGFGNLSVRVDHLHADDPIPYRAGRAKGTLSIDRCDSANGGARS